jgi:apolipoprotein N-acyltransferase
MADPETHDSPAAADPRWRLLGLGATTGVLLFLCHFPVAWGWLAWVALVPLLTAVRSQARTRWLFWSSWVGGLIYYYAAISWMTVADTRMIACWVLLATYCSLYFPLTVCLVRRLEQYTRLPLLVTLPVVWTALEYFRCFFGTGFPWYQLGHTQHNVLPLIQIADLGGGFAVSFLVAAVNVVVFEALSRWQGWRRFAQLPELSPDACCRSLFAQVACVLLLIGAALTYGAWSLAHDDFETGPRVALLQANLDQRLKNNAHQSHEARDRVRTAYKTLCDQAAALEPRPALIVWPETSCPDPWYTVTPNVDLARQPPRVQEAFALQQGLVRRIARSSKTHVLVGINTQVEDYGQKSSRYNSALLLDPSRRACGLDVLRYDKLHRVPFGEYVPLRGWVPFMDKFAPYDFDYSIGCGDGFTRFPLGKYRFGVLICYEDTDPFLAREYATDSSQGPPFDWFWQHAVRRWLFASGADSSDGPPVDFLLNISNDGWFDGSSEHEEHLAICRFRAIESRKAVARAVNMGVTAVIDSDGRVLAPVKSREPGKEEVWTIPANAGSLSPGEWSQYKQVDGILVVDMPIDRRGSFYAVYGDWLPTACWLVVLGGMSWTWTRRWRSKPQAAKTSHA